MPSGRLCRVTEVKSILLSPKLRLALFSSSPSFTFDKSADVTTRKRIPHQTPNIAGRKANLPNAAELSYSIAGISRLHTDAAIITPAAIPEIALLKPLSSSPLIKKTQAAPSTVPKSGIIHPKIISKIIT